jgi:hypothetical protein
LRKKNFRKKPIDFGACACDLVKKADFDILLAVCGFDLEIW